jgi:hypothetical protein
VGTRRSPRAFHNNRAIAARSATRPPREGIPSKSSRTGCNTGHPLEAIRRESLYRAMSPSLALLARM